MATLKKYSLVILAILGLVLVLFFVFNKEVDEAKKEGVTEERNRSLMKDLEILDGDKKANEKAQTHATNKREETSKQLADARHTLVEKEAFVIETTEDKQLQSQQLSLVRMQALWQAYCVVEPTNEQCRQQGLPLQAAKAPERPATEVPTK